MNFYYADLHWNGREYTAVGSCQTDERAAIRVHYYRHRLGIHRASRLLQRDTPLYRRLLAMAHDKWERIEQ